MPCVQFPEFKSPSTQGNRGSPLASYCCLSLIFMMRDNNSDYDTEVSRE